MLSEFILKASEESLGRDETWRQPSREHFTNICQLLPFGCFHSVVVSLHAGGLMVEKTGIRNEVAILDSRG